MADLFEYSLPPLWILFASSDFEENRGPKEEDPRTQNQAGIDSSFALSATAEGVSHRVSGSANPETLSLAATGK